MTRRLTALAVPGLLALALALAGCGLQPLKVTKGVDYEITQNFGDTKVASTQTPSVTSTETVLSALQKYFTVTTGAHRAVISINGVRENTHTNRRWFYFVNGIQATRSAATTGLSNGDVVWWDLHDRSGTGSVPAVVGSYPEPFSTGSGGQQYPTVLTCATPGSTACDVVARSLTKAGVKVSDQALGTGSGSDSLAVLVGTYAQLRGVIATELLAAGPTKSGVYARFVGDAGTVLELDDASGEVARTLYGSAGLIAATQQPTLNQPVWLVPGPTPAPVQAAASHLTAADLHEHFAVAVTGGKVVPLPVGGT